MTDDRFVRISAEQAEWLRIAAKRMAFDESLLAATAVITEVAAAYERAPRTRLAALLGRAGRTQPLPAAVVPEPEPATVADSPLPSSASPDDHGRL
jgi:hypothetical protein